MYEEKAERNNEERKEIQASMREIKKDESKIDGTNMIVMVYNEIVRYIN